MNIEDMKLKDVMGLTKMFGVSPDVEEDWGKQIVILQRGWVVVGDLKKNGVQFTLNNASVIRNWGTTRGLGEIAEGGPTDNTKLDPAPEMKFHELTVIGTIKCNKSKWT